MKHTFKFSFLIFIFWFVQCSWVQERDFYFWPTNRNLIYNSEEVAYFHISPSKVELFETLIAPGPFTHPTQLTPEQWKDLLGNLKYIKKILTWFFYGLHVFRRRIRKHLKRSTLCFKISTGK